MTISDSTQPARNSLSRDIFSAARYYVGSRFGLLAIAALALGLGAYSSWGWLVAAGIAPLLLTFAPCAAMCALGLCSMGGKSKSATDVVSPGTIEGPETKLPLSLAAPGTAQDENQTDQVKTGKRKGCC